ncbi:MAG: GNAT family N-acetyltransferase [Nocardioides sp.]
MDLPTGYTARPLRHADAADVAAVIAEQELADIGEVVIEEADIVAEWQRPSYDLGASSVGVLRDDRLVAYAEAMPGGRGDAAVHPDHRGRGLGTALARWIQDTARAQGQSVIGMPVPEGSPGDLLLASLGYRVRWHSWVLQLPAGTSIPERPLPAGYAVRAATADEHEACWTVQEDAFLEWSVRDRSTFADWAAGVVGRPGFEPWQLRVVTDPGGEVVAMAVLQMGPGGGFVDKLATRRDQRGRGLAQCLLVDAFREAVAHGAQTCELSTDSRTGALGLYEKVGMVVTSSWVNRAVDL